MKILFDQNLPIDLRRFLPDHEVYTAAQMGWDAIENGELLSVAEGSGFGLFITAD